MSLTTLRRYLNQSEEEAGCRRVISLLLDGIADHAVCANSAEIKAFREALKAIRLTASPESASEQLLAAAETTIQTLDSYNARTTHLLKRQADELQNMIAMLAQAVIKISGASERSIDALHHIKRELESAVAIGDVEKVKLRLSDCLKTVCDETSRHQRETEAILGELQRDGPSPSDGAVRTDDGVDPVTGLPQASAAKAAFAKGLKSPGRKYIVIMVVDRLQLINGRFGSFVGDEVLRVMRKHIESKVLGPGDQLFRWRGPAFLALIARPESIDQVRSSLKRVLERKIENEFDVGGRTALITLSFAWTAIALIPPASNLPSFVDKFVAAQVPRDYC